MEHSAVLMTPFVFTESSDEDEASGDEGLPDDESEVRDAMLHKCMYACMQGEEVSLSSPCATI